MPLNKRKVIFSKVRLNKDLVLLFTSTPKSVHDGQFLEGGWGGGR